MSIDYLLYLEKECLAKDNDTFLYKFHEENIFDFELYQSFKNHINLFVDNYYNNRENTKYIKLRSRLIDVFFYIMSSFFYHYQENDLSEINNMDDIDYDTINDMFSEFRETAQKLLRSDFIDSY